MLYLVELDHVKSGSPLTPDKARAFVEGIIYPTLAQAEKLVAEKKIVAGGPVAGRIALRIIVDAESPQELDRIVSRLPLWPLSDSRVTPLVAFGDRRESLQALLASLG